MFASQTRDLSHIELARSDNISSSSKARTYRVGEAHISTERKTRARIRGENPSILALSVCNKGLGLAHLRLNRQMRCLHFTQTTNSPLSFSIFT